MENFVNSLPLKLEELKSHPHSKSGLIIVMGNEACDLDSAVSALVYAHFLAQQNPTKDVLPMLNVLREELPLKTEVIHCIGTKLGLDISNILCRDDLPLESLSGEFQLVLVDHHALTGTDVQFSDQVTEIIDHHPIEKPPSVENARIELVGSCTTLVLDKIWQTDPDYRNSDALNLVRWTILVDTVNLSEAAKKATDDDVRILRKIEKFIPESENTRTAHFNEISEVKRDISGLTVGQLMRKDLKIVQIENVTVAMSSVMMSARQMAEKANFVEEVDSFLSTKKSSFSFIMGAVVSAETGELERDILIYPVTDENMAGVLADRLPEREELMLSRESPLKSAIVLFRQGDVSFSRKKILPIIKSILRT